MNWFEEILAALSGTMARPEMFGWFHLLSIGVTIALIVLVCFFLRKKSDKVNRIVLLAFAIVFIVFEIYKQLAYVWFNSNTGEWSYSWYAFPFQFCSTPMYIALIAGILRPGKVQNWCMAFLATFGTIAGICVLMYPSGVFVEMIGINIQTMVVHGGMIVLGVYCLLSGRVKLHVKSILPAAVIFTILATIALISNIIMYHTVSKSFNMFYLSPLIPNHMPVFGDVYNAVPFPVYFLIYIVGFSLASLLVLLIAMGIGLLLKKTKNKKPR
ncbi:MAG: YwaF family protein [Firmicutes bacterium]|nr:YwaF family protein [Bacillota bacterium]